ncbi:7048_t:CDS:2 [Dentiscutata erythropus]|uniref:7048_t:CDS:1 n=1 Tax=Dentiscutata erythropus TaxID=1348616 RepID=A0A9N9NXU2_9GLOM|nr:7048_t:CDS:2 [Dentiscutata erythropus]
MSDEVGKVCELVTLQKENCKACTITTFLNNSHYFKKSEKHEHGPSATSGEIVQTISQIKQQARNTRDKPSKIIQNNIAVTPTNLLLYMPTKEALRMRIKRVRKNAMLPEPKTLEEIKIPITLRYTLSDESFLIEDSEYNQTLNDFAKDNYIQLNPSTIITDFELAVVNASSNIFLDNS